MTETATTFPAPGSPAPGAPPALRRDGGRQVAAASPAAAVHPAAPADAPAARTATPDLGAARLVAALAGTAVGLWLERRWRR